MKVLITGFTGIQCRASLGQLQLISNIESIWGALNDLGHEVDWRPVTPGEDIDEYDRCIVSINGVASWTAPYALGALFVMGKRRDTVLTYDDWQGPSAFSSGDPNKEMAVVWNEKLQRANHFEAIENEATRDAINAAVTELCYVHYRKVLIPSFAHGGDLELLNLGAPNAMAYDPSAYMIDKYEYAPNSEKARMWVSAALAPKEPWFLRQNFTWPLELYGIRKFGQPRVVESELASVYSQRWGVVSAPHKHVGSGWFRVRFLMAALAGSVVYCDPREGATITPHAVYGMPLDFIEKHTDTGLRELATAQRLAFFEKCWSKERLQEELDDFVIKAGSPDHGVKLFEQREVVNG